MSGHWYDLQRAELVHTVRYANGRSGPPSLVHARKLGLGPGSTTIIKTAAREQLESWKRGQILQAVLRQPQQADESADSFINRILDESGKQAAEAATLGSQIHHEIEQYYATGECAPMFTPVVEGVERCIRETFGDRPTPWIAEQCVTHSFGWGTKVDLYSRDHRGNMVVLDFKTKDFGPDGIGKLDVYRDHFMQLGASCVALHGMDALGDSIGDHIQAAIVYVSRTHPGLCWPIGVSVAELRRGWEMFQLLLAFWKLDNKYDPSEALAK